LSAFRRGHETPGPLPTDRRPPEHRRESFSHRVALVRCSSRSTSDAGRGVGASSTAQASGDRRHGIDNRTINPAMLRMLLERSTFPRRLGAVRYGSSGTAASDTSRRVRSALRNVPVCSHTDRPKSSVASPIEGAHGTSSDGRGARARSEGGAGVECGVTVRNGSIMRARSGRRDPRAARIVDRGLRRRQRGLGEPVEAEGGWFCTRETSVHLDEDGYL